MSTAIVWFRRDLRLADNPALATACARHDRIVPLFVHAPDEEGEWAPGGAQRWWLHHSLDALAEAFGSAGSSLVIRRGPTQAALEALVHESGATAVYWNRLYDPALTDRDAGIKQWLQAEAGVEAESFNAALLFEPWTVRTGQGQPYRVFTPFWRQIQKVGLPANLHATPDPLPRVPRGITGDSVASLELLPQVRWDVGLGETWTPGEVGAHERLAFFRNGILADYGSRRDEPGRDGTSALSPYLHFGEIGPRQIVHAIRATEPPDASAAKKYLRQIAWREFAHHLLFHFPRTPTEPLDPKFETFPWRDPRGEAAPDLAAWQAGRTGVPLVDAGMRQLWHSGWVHNRVRMVAASFLTKNLQLHWLEGARWFWDTLVDADLASNTLGWQWTAGCGADAAPYFRVFNPARQGERFDPNARYVRRWVPEIAALPDRYIHAPWQAPQKVLDGVGIGLGRDYPHPIADLAASRRAALDAFQSLGPDNA